MREQTGFTWKPKVKHISTGLNKHCGGCTLMLPFCFINSTHCTHLILWLVFHLSECLSEQNERAGGSIKMQGWWMKRMKERQEKEEEEEGAQAQKGDKRAPCSSGSVKSDNRMIKLSAKGMLVWWVSFFLTYFLLHRDKTSLRKYTGEAIWPALPRPHTHTHTHTQHCVKPNTNNHKWPHHHYH